MQGQPCFITMTAKMQYFRFMEANRIWDIIRLGGWPDVTDHAFWLKYLKY